MSADLFAQFGSFSGNNSTTPDQRQSQTQSQAGNTKTQSGADDPFAFLSSSFSQPPPQRSPQPSPQFQSPSTFKAPTQQQQAWPNFGVPLQPTHTVQSPQPSLDWGAAGTWSSSIAAAPPQSTQSTDDEDEDDAWGDFEEASPGTQGLGAQTLPSYQAQPQYQQPQPQIQARPQPAAAQPANPPIRNRIVRAPTIDLLSNSLINFNDLVPTVASTYTPPPPPPPQVKPAPQSSSRPPWMIEATSPAAEMTSDVLFDAEDFDENELSDDDEDDDDDEFGEFETGHTSPPSTTATSSKTMSQPVAPSAPPPTAATASLIDLMSLADPVPATLTSSPSLPIDQSFAGLGFGQRPPPRARQHAANHLSPLTLGSTALGTIPQTPKSPSFRERNPFPGLAVTTPLSAQFPAEKVKNRTPSPVTNWPTFNSAPQSPNSPYSPKKPAPKPKAVVVPQVIEDDWDAWAVPDSATVQPAVKASKPANKSAKVSKHVPKKAEPAESDWGWGAEDSPRQDLDTSVDLPSSIASTPAAKTLPDSAPPPTNVPPPAILMSLFPSLMALPEETLFKPTASQPAEVRNRVLSHPKTIAFLRNYLQIIVVAVRVIAGRKQRWHRDRFLAQSMSISAAGSSKGGGMKLAGIDKTQNQREDREAADVVAAWRRYVGKLRSAVATVNTALVAAEAADHKHYPPLKMPELQSETVPVTTVKQVPTSARPCVICGLKRDERVRGVDGDDVQDIFGEWWVEHWGHRACRNFWIEHEATLRSR